MNDRNEACDHKWISIGTLTHPGRAICMECRVMRDHSFYDLQASNAQHEDASSGSTESDLEQEIEDLKWKLREAYAWTFAAVILALGVVAWSATACYYS